MQDTALARVDDARMRASLDAANEGQKGPDGSADGTSRDAKPDNTAGPGASRDEFVLGAQAERILSMPANAEPASFALAEGDQAPALPETALQRLAQAAALVEEAGYACGYALVDLGSGRGVAGNADEALYTASSFKAPFSCYLLRTGVAEEWERDQIEASILYSDNDAFEALATAHLGQDYQDWLESQGIEYDGWSPWYPHASAASMAACWAEIYRFAWSDEADAAWFRDLMANTNLSFIRDALDGQDVQVWNKAGWITDDEGEAYNALADCGIVEAKGRCYLLCVLTNQPSEGSTQERLENLIEALFELADDLG